MKKVIMYEKIYEELRQKIEGGIYHQGDRLPSEKELAAQYQVSRITSKKALDVLAEKGYIVRSAGRGSFVNVQILEEREQQSDLEAPYVGERALIGVIFDSFGSDFGSELLRSIEISCRHKGYAMLFQCSYGSIELENQAIECALKLGAKGLIIMCSQGETYNNLILRLALNNFPIVLVDRSMEGISIPCIKTDNYRAAKELTQILIQRGHKKLCFLSHGTVNTPTIAQRHSGFVDGVMEYPDVTGVAVQVESYNPAPEDIMEEYQDYDFTEMDRILEKYPDRTAFLAAEYKLGALMQAALERKGIKAEVAAFDGVPKVFDWHRKTTYVRQNEQMMGSEAVKTLQQILRGETVERVINVPYEIVNT